MPSVKYRLSFVRRAWLLRTVGATIALRGQKRDRFEEMAAAMVLVWLKSVNLFTSAPKMSLKGVEFGEVAVGNSKQGQHAAIKKQRRRAVRDPNSAAFKTAD